MENRVPSLEQFTTDFLPLVKKIAKEVLRSYSGWFKDPSEELKDLIASGMLELVSIFKKVDFLNEGYGKYVALRVRGCLLNYVHKNIPIVGNDGGNEDGQHTGGRAKHVCKFIHTVPIDSLCEFSELEGDQDQDMDLLLFRHEVLILIGEFMSDLTPRERFMFIARFQDEIGYREIGMVVQAQRDTVSRKISEILEKLRKFLWRKRSWRLDTAAIADYLKETDLGMVISSEAEESPSPAGKEKHT